MLTWNSVSAAAPFTTYTSWANTFGPLAWMFSTNPERSEASPRGARGMCWEWYTASAPAEVGRARTAIAIKAPAASGDRCFFFQAEDGIRDFHVTGVQTCALPI